MFSKILIANRGEIACRIIKTAQKMGISCVAVYSAADRDALHVELADEAVFIGAAPPKDSYLNGDAIIRAALETGAQAVHPGYGFLSENPHFVRALEAAGLVFIGPSAEAIELMGLKDGAKKHMIAAGVPVVPGYHGGNQEADYLARQADQIGYPLFIKAVAGGGGRGMRVVHHAGEFHAALHSAQGEAQNAFGCSDVLLEKYVEKARHIEMQIFGDGQDAVYLFERDCSLQRRHQKVIEEAPAPGMDEAMRVAMGQAACRAAQSVGYKGAGTVEFLVDTANGLRPDGFWFMEMNTRLQVEHPVTEAITGLDLVEWQLRIAAGERLPKRQDEITLQGHAFEARLYAEDVAAGFLPAVGRLAHLAFPPDVRVETGVRGGDVISPWYDPMIAKLVVHGPTRDSALVRLQRALEQTCIAGTVTNLGFLAALSHHAGFAQGEVDTGLIARDLAGLLPPAQPAPHIWAQAFAAQAGLTGAPMEGFCLWGSLRRPMMLHHGDIKGEGLLHFGPQGAMIAYEGGDYPLADLRLPIVRMGDMIYIFDHGVCFAFQEHDLLAQAQADVGELSGQISAPMPGMIKDVFVAQGQNVQKDDPLIMLEAMKMAHQLRAPWAGVVRDVMVEAGMQVDFGDVLLALDKDDRHDAG